MNTTKNQNGFTLIEMMIVVAIIAIMSAMLAPTLFNQVSKAEKARTASDIRLIESALKFYRLDNYRYPSQAEGLEALVSAPSGAASSWNGPYLESLPLDAWKEPYKYANPGTHGTPVEVYTLGADKTPGGSDSNTDLGSWNIND